MLQKYGEIRRRRLEEGDDSGFTLIELLIVIIVLGILAAVVIFALGSVTSKSAVSACQADGATVATALAAYNTQNSATATPALLTSSSTAGGPYLQSWPSNLPHYAFALDGSGNLYVFTGINSLATTPTALTGNLAPGALSATKTAPNLVTTGLTVATNIVVVPSSGTYLGYWMPWQGNGPNVCAGVL